MRAAEELRSALIFRALARAAAAAKLPAPWTTRFAAMVGDEIGHARLGAEVGSRLGADRPRYDARPVRARLATLTDPDATQNMHAHRGSTPDGVDLATSRGDSATMRGAAARFPRQLPAGMARQKPQPARRTRRS